MPASGRVGVRLGSVTENPTERPTAPPASLRYRLIVAAALVVASVALVAGILATDTDEDDGVLINGRPDVVEHVIPADGAHVLHQTEIGIDLAAGYEGTLGVNGTPIPTDELRLVPEQNQVFFLPGPDKVFEALPTGRNCVTALVWKSSVGQGKGSDLSFQWCFDVT